ncbi:ImmA/IrrE family metallo-endopeptidase [Curtobacterium sp. MCBD17_008]|uniref:ImmA/IrrE family metallo-endopeptidase n=1 Tax=Curtobacterium sp. MCBD17_008 TaxID=2175656 RepID=UPI000DA87F9F|nr:ImmA/IrrE family metallo-endopeptidase [Curtobacterium sp. MCBD17_008]PZE89976.1 ImmA/IrrE family metallo-endopeptidase [Curtobacterium sp. MCBD17_008]
MDVFALIEDLGVRLEYRTDLPPGRLGAYYDDERLIVVRSNLTLALEAETLCHEYVHAKYRDRSCHPTLEHRAQREAALMLIHPDDYARAERVNTSPLAIAQELGVTLHLVRVFQHGVMSGMIRLPAVA